MAKPVLKARRNLAAGNWKLGVLPSYKAAEIAVARPRRTIQPGFLFHRGRMRPSSGPFRVFSWFRQAGALGALKISAGWSPRWHHRTVRPGIIEIAQTRPSLKPSAHARLRCRERTRWCVALAVASFFLRISTRADNAPNVNSSFTAANSARSSTLPPASSALSRSPHESRERTSRTIAPIIRPASQWSGKPHRVSEGVRIHGKLLKTCSRSRPGDLTA